MKPSTVVTVSAVPCFSTLLSHQPQQSDVFCEYIDPNASADASVRHNLPKLGFV